MRNINIIIAVAQIKKVQWYQAEIFHVSVQNGHEGKGLGSKVLQLAEGKAKSFNVRVLQCTIRTDNNRSESLFLKNEFTKTSQFYNVVTRNVVNVYQKAIVTVDR